MQCIRAWKNAEEMLLAVEALVLGYWVVPVGFRLPRQQIEDEKA